MRPPGIGRLLAVAVLIVTASTQVVFLLGAAFLTVGPELGFSATGLGVLTATFFLTASLSSAPLGRVVQRIGWQRSMRYNAAGSALVLILVATTAQSVAWLAFLLFAGGLIYGLANPAANQALADHVDPRHRALVFGLKHAGIPASTLLAGLAVPILVLNVGWQPTFAIAATLPVVVALLVPRGRVPATAFDFPLDVKRQVAPMSMALLVGLGASSALATWAAIALSTYLVAAAADVGFTESAAGYLLFAGSVASITARVLAGVVTDARSGKGFWGIAFLTGLGAFVFIGIAATTGVAFALLVLVGFGTGWGWPGLMTYTVVNANIGSAAASSGVTQAGVFVGAGVGPIVLGRVVDAWSFSAAFVVVAVALALAALGAAWVGRQAVAV